MTSELLELLPYLTPREREKLDLLLLGNSAWSPNSEPQALAYHSQADILFYGGAAGGGKTDLLLGLARHEHYRSIIFRRIFPSLAGIIERSMDVYAPDGVGRGAIYNESLHRWKLGGGRTIRFGSMQYEENKTDWQGTPYDFYGFDEITEFTEAQFRFVTGWNRSTRKGQRCRVVCTGNPPTTDEGEWVLRFWAPWLDDSHPHPAVPGELRYYTTIRGEDVEMPNDDLVEVDGPKGLELVRPRSRTFYPAKYTDNPALRDTSYGSVLQGLPEPLRSKLLYGDFKAGREDNAYQVIPSAWVRAAQDRWKARPRPPIPMTDMGVDVARGGKAKTVLSPRRGNYFDEQIVVPGSKTPDGPSVAAVVTENITDEAVVKIDVVGVGTSPFDCLRNGWVDSAGAQRPGIGERAIAMNGAEGSDAHDKTGKLGFVNQRAEWYWKFREALDPLSGQDVALPADPELRADLCAPRWKLTVRGIQVELKEELAKRLGRSPDKGDAAVNAAATKGFAGAGVFDYYRQEAERARAAKGAR